MTSAYALKDVEIFDTFHRLVYSILVQIKPKAAATDWPVQFTGIDCHVTCQLAICMTSVPRRLLRRTDVSICHQRARVSTINKVVVTLLHNFQSAPGRTGLRELERREPGRCSVLPGARADRCLRSVSWDGAFSVTATRQLARRLCIVQNRRSYGARFIRIWSVAATPRREEMAGKRN